MGPLVPSVANCILLPKVALARSVMLTHSGGVADVVSANVPTADDAGVLPAVALAISPPVVLLLLPNPHPIGDG